MSSPQNTNRKEVSDRQYSMIYLPPIEVYRFLTAEVHAYLPSYDTVTVWHLRDLVSFISDPTDYCVQ